MAAPIKQGLEFFPYEIGLLQDKKLRRPKMQYGAVAAIIYIALLEMIYSQKGYYLEYQDKKDDVIWEIQEYLHGKYQPDADTVSDVIDGLVACELFSGDYYPKIITSKRVQATFYRATVARKAVDIDFDVWMLSEEEMKAISAKSLILTKFINRTNNGVNRSNNGVNRTIYPQIEKEIEKEIIPSARARVAGGIPSLDEVVSFCRKYNLTTDPNWFYEYNQKRAWRINGEPIRHWQALLMQWGKHAPGDADKAYTTRKYTDAELNALVDDISKVEF